MNYLTYLLRRSALNWQLLLTLTLGVVLAVALMASGPVIVDTVLDFSLRRKLITTDPQETNLQLTTHDQLGSSQYIELNTEVRDLLRIQLSEQIDITISSGETTWAYPWVDGQIRSRQRINFRFYGMEWEQLETRVIFVSGGLPEQTNLGEGIIHALVPEGMANQYGLAITDELPISIQSNADSPDYRVRIAGIIRPVDSEDPYWLGAKSPMRSHPDARHASQYNVLVGLDDFFEIATHVFPSSRQQYTWISLLDVGRITLRDLPSIENSIHAASFAAHDLEEGIDLETGLPELISLIVPHSEGVRAPLYFLITAVVLLALYYVIMVATLSARQSRREFAVLRSRGASKRQILGVQLIEASVISVIGLISGPGLAVLLMRWLVRSGPLADVAQADWLLSIPQEAWLAAIVATTACLAGLFAPSPGAVQRSIVSHAATLSRSGRKPWWQRFYVDVFLLIIGLILLWRLNLVGGIVEGSGAAARVDWLLLLSPLALLLGAATITLRVFPLLLDVGSKVISRGRGLPGALAVWQAARDPVHIARLVLLLTLAMSLGLLSTGLNTALNRNERDRSNYAVGSDIRIILPEDIHRGVGEGNVTNIGEVTSEIPGVTAMEPALRTSGSLQMTVANAHPQFDLLAIPPEEFIEVTYLRDDYAADPITEMLSNLEVGAEKEFLGFELPGRPTRIGMWIHLPFQGEMSLSIDALSTSSTYDELNLLAKLHTLPGETFTLRLRMDPVDAEVENGWRYFQAEMSPLSDSSYPLTLDSLWIGLRMSYDYGLRSSMLTRLGVDDLSVFDSETGQTMIFEDFETTQSRWLPHDLDMDPSLQIGFGHTSEKFLQLDYWFSGYDPVELLRLTPHDEPPSPLDGEEEFEDPPLSEEVEILLPPNTAQIGIWVAFPMSGWYRMGPDVWYPVGNHEDLSAELVLQSGQGEEVIVPLDYLALDPSGPEDHTNLQWHHLGAMMPPLPEGGTSLKLSSLRLKVKAGAMLPIVRLDDLYVVTSEEQEVVTTFDEEGSFWDIEHATGIGYAYNVPNGRTDAALTVAFERMGDVGDLGWWELKPRQFLTAPGDEDLNEPEPEEEMVESLATLPVLVSERFLETTQVSIGDSVGAWIESRPFQLQVVGELHYFPTLVESKDAGFVVTDQYSIIGLINEVEEQAVNPNEYFISTQEGTSSEVRMAIQRVMAGEVQVLEANSLRKTIKSDPLALGLRSVTTLGYLLTSVLSLVGFATYFYVSVRQRRKMYAVLRALGMSTHQLYGTLLLEQLILIFSGLGLGTGLGLLLNALTLPGLPLSLGGQPPIPPFLAEIEWIEVGRVYLTLAIAFLISLGLATFSLNRARLHRIMRVDEE